MIGDVKVEFGKIIKDKIIGSMKDMKRLGN